MSDQGNPGNGSTNALPKPRPAFPIARALYAIGYGFIAYFVLIALFVIGVIQFIFFALNGRVNDELKGFGGNLVQYLGELLAFIVFVRDEQPFPMGPFPRHA